MPDAKTKTGKTLRRGFTTGTYATATAVGAWQCLHGKIIAREVPILLPDGRLHHVNVDAVRNYGRRKAEAWATKNAGDDPDITHKAVIRAEICRARNEDTRPEDFVEICGSSRVILRGKAGIGLVERKGLDVPPGKWAINPVPRRMIIENLKRNGLGRHEEPWLLSLSIDHGGRLAKRTLNPIIGITGGLSILGTSGIVHPCSNAAYKETIRVLIRAAARTGLSRVALVTGGRTHRWTRRRYPELAEPAIVRIGDFIRESLGYCNEFGMEKVMIVCMHGKLAKYAMGHAYTHAHRVSLSMPAVGELLVQKGFPPHRAAMATDCATVREYFHRLNDDETRWAEDILRAAALGHFSQWAPGTTIVLHAVDGNQST